MTETVAIDSQEEEKDPKAAKHRYLQEISFYEEKSSSWEEKSNKIIRRYKDERSPRESRVGRFNILWSNVQTLMQALYSRLPKPDIERRFRDKDKLGRVSSQVLERAITFFVNQQYDNVVRQAVLDRLLPGRGTAWVRYEPKFKDIEFGGTEGIAEDGAQITDDAGYDESEYGDESLQEVADELLCWDYVHWGDFGHNNARTWEEVYLVWRKAYMSSEELIKRFGKEKADKIPLDYVLKGVKDQTIPTAIKKATIYELWDKSECKAVWLHKDVDDLLDEMDDPLRLSGFFPCPQPLYATLANDDLLPVADYREYQDQAIELDDLTSRIMAMQKAIKAAGCYDASVPALQRILSEGVENQLIPVDQWAILSEKGGLAGAIQFLPMQEIAKTLLNLYEAREKVKSDLYEISGMSDILRGATNPIETATAQSIKSKFATLRLGGMQDDVSRFNRDLIKIGAEIIAEHFQIETLKKISGIQLLTAQEKQFLQAKASNPQLAMMPLPPELANMNQSKLAELMEQPTWEEVAQLFKDERLLSYKVDIETDSTIKFDEDAEREARTSFLTAVGGFLKEAMAVQTPELAPLMAKMLMFGVRGFKVGKELESSFELAIEELEKKAAAPQQPKVDPEMQKMQIEMQLKQQEMQLKAQLDREAMQNDLQLKQAQMQMDLQREEAESQQQERRLAAQAQVDSNQANVDSQLERMKHENEMQLKMAIEKLKVETQIMLQEMKLQADANMQSQAISANNVVEQFNL